MSATPIAKRPEIDPHIDRLRGLFAICVAFGHTYDLSRIQAPVDFATNVVATARNFLGFSWVVGFIVLSGYCIARSTVGSGRPFSLKRYLLLRATRIFPLLITCALLAGFFEYVMFRDSRRPELWTSGIDFIHFLAAMLGMSGFYGQLGSYAPSYTVSYELLYYALWGGILAFVPRSRVTLLAAFLLAVLLYATSAPLAAMLMQPANANYIQWVLMLFIVWLMGAALYFYEERVIAWVRGTPVSLAWGGWLAFSVIMANNGGHPLFAKASGAAFWFYMGLSACFCLVIATYLAADKTGDTSWFDRWLGEISYPIFLVHGPVIIFTGYLLNCLDLKLTFLPYLFLCLAMSLLFAHLLALFVERSVGDWRRGLRLAPIAAVKTMPNTNR